MMTQRTAPWEHWHLERVLNFEDLWTSTLLLTDLFNFSRGVISEPDLLTTPDAEILDGFSGQGVIQAELVPSTSCYKVASPSQSPPPNSVIDTTPSTSNSLSISCCIFLIPVRSSTTL
ncbi:hypothetical protein TNCV_5075011 [Trichonephila clavipes]|nr:hypothetical protein TNCV_5075011 [Trichonephila clavipes]